MTIKTGYQVHYKSYSQDRTGGGWTNRVSYIEELGELENFERIDAVTPVTMEFGDAITSQAIQEALQARKEEREREAADAEIEHAERKLEAARRKRDKLA